MIIWRNIERAQFLFKAFYAIILVTIVNIVGELFYLNYLTTYFDKIDLDTYSNIEIFLSIISIIFLIVYTSSVIFFLKWFRRSYGNLHRLEFLKVKYQEKMTLWAWIMPLICLWRPCNIMNEIDFKTQMAILKLNPNFGVKRNQFLIQSWWVLYIVSNFLGRYFIKHMFDEDQTVEGIIQYTQISIASDIIMIVEAILVICIVKKISQNEEILAMEVLGNGGIVEEVK